MSKINIYKSGSDKWKDALFSHVDPDIFPKCFGGNYVENGDERCCGQVFYEDNNYMCTYIHAKIFEAA